MAIIAQAHIQDKYIIPIPIECTPENLTGDEQIIIAVTSVPPPKELLFEIYAFYGTENCEKLIGQIPPREECQTIICVKSHCLLDHAQNLEGKSPPAHISPLWTEDRFGVSSAEAQILGVTSKDMMNAVHLKMCKFRKELDDLKIKTNKQALLTINSCEQIIQKAQKELEIVKKDCRWLAAENVAKFLRDKFKVDAWVDLIVEPAVLFCVSKRSNDDQAVITGCSIEGIMNEIEPDNAARFFDSYVYDASVFPIVMDVSFLDGKRITSKKEYYSSAAGGIS